MGTVAIGTTSSTVVLMRMVMVREISMSKTYYSISPCKVDKDLKVVKIKWPRALKGKIGWVFLDFLSLFLLNLIDLIFSIYSYNFLKLHVCREKGPRDRGYSVVVVMLVAFGVKESLHYSHIFIGTIHTLMV